MKKIIFLLLIAVSSGLILPTAGYTQSLTDGLVSVWELDETNGIVVEDSHSNNNMSNDGATVNQTGKFGQCYSFDGTNDNIYLPNSFFQNKTISFWFKTSGSGGLVGFHETPESPGSVVTGKYVPVCYISKTTHRLRCSIWDGSQKNLGTSFAVNDNKWHHVVITIMQNHFEAWIDSVSLGSHTATWSNSSPYHYLGVTPAHGYYDAPTTWFYYNGLMDQVATWDRALTQEEISLLYSEGNGLDYDQWDKPETGGGSGGTVTSVDFSSSDLTVSGAPVTTSGTIVANLSNSAIANQPSLSSGLVSTDELFVSDNNTLKKMDVSVLQSYMQSNLSFGSEGGDSPWDSNTGYISHTSGNVHVGSAAGDKNLNVYGTINAKEVVVQTTLPVPDYVFEEDYPLKSLQEIEAYINKNKHLPEIPSENEIHKNGVNLTEMNLLLLKKIEELTLHTINQQKMLEKQEKTINQLKQEIIKLK